MHDKHNKNKLKYYNCRLEICNRNMIRTPAKLNVILRIAIVIQFAYTSANNLMKKQICHITILSMLVR